MFVFSRQKALAGIAYMWSFLMLHRNVVKREEADMDEEEIHIAVGKNLKKEKANILWAAAKFPRATIVLVHVHWPSKWMPFMGGKVLYKYADEKEKAVHRSRETEAMGRLLSQYRKLCGIRQVRAYYHEHEDVLTGIINLVKRLRIKRLIIGSRYMSKQAALRQCCQVWLVREGKHRFTSNNELEHAESRGYGGRQESIASIHELSSEESDGYATPPCDLGDESTNEEGDHEIQIIETDQMAMENRTIAEQDGEESVIDQNRVEPFPEEVTDRDRLREHNSFGNDAGEAARLREQLDELQRKIEQLERGDHNLKDRCLSSKQKDALLKQKSSTKTMHQELEFPEKIKQVSMLQLARATNNFDSSNFIAEGGYGPVYRGKIGGIPVAIKLLKTGSKQGYPEYQQEVDVLSRIEHPNIIKLIGVCPDSLALVYEYLPNGTLRERLSEGLAWTDRIRIIRELQSALKCLHSNRPHAIIHADLKFSNILFDANNISRLGDFGIARAVHIKPLEEETICRKTNPMGTMGYMDPVFFVTGELTTESDIYSFGIVILQLLTGLSELDIVKQVEEALRTKAVGDILDASARGWPVAQTERLLRLALKCCSFERKRRPDIASNEWKVLDVLQATAGKSIIA